MPPKLKLSPESKKQLKADVFAGRGRARIKIVIAQAAFNLLTCNGRLIAFNKSVFF